MRYPIKAKSGNPLLTVNGETLSLENIVEKLCSNDKNDQLSICESLGLKLTAESIEINFNEEGKIYEFPDQDRSKIAQNVTKSSFNLSFKQTFDESQLPMKVEFDFDEITEQTYVNFLGEIRFDTIDGDKRIIPLTGRGTAALEGRLNDAHAGLCTGRACASFQQKTAIIVMFLAFLELNRDNLEIFRAHLLNICKQYHGRDDVINYTIDKAFNLTNIDYFSYMDELYPNEQPLMLRHFKEFAEPHPQYYVMLRNKLSNEEFEEELVQVSENVNNIKISLKVKEIVNKFILYKGLYHVKPFAGKRLEENENFALSIYDFARYINTNNSNKIRDAFKQMGIEIFNDKLTVTFKIKGRKLTSYVDVLKFESKETEETFQMDLLKSNKDWKFSHVKIILDIKPINKVNYFGKIEVKSGLFSKSIIPLLGRGTLDPNGIITENFSNFCIDGEFASFQQKVAIFYVFFAKVFNVDNESFREFHLKIQALNVLYFKREIILEYLFRQISGEIDINFFEYSRQANKHFKSMPIAIKTILTYDRLPSRFFEELITNFSEDEIVSEEKRFEVIKYIGIFPTLLNKLKHAFDEEY